MSTASPTPRTRLVSYSTPAGRSFGLVDRSGDGVVDLGARLPEHADLAALIAADAVTAAVERFADQPADVALDAITFERLVDRPGKIFCIGVNYGGRTAEYTDTSDAEYPSVFVRFPESLTGHDRPILRPAESDQLDYEGEIVAVVGRAGRRIPIERAREHLAGCTLGNEGSVRDWLRHAKFNVTQGKNWERSGALGPWLVPIDELPPFDEMELSTRVNGELRQHDTPATMKYSIEYQVSYLSTFITLEPGDLIFTGTPIGAGARFDPPRWLVPGDVVEVSVPELGTLRNAVTDDDAREAAG
ncbi:MAG TPA: fumarylacetoacetate hydrolase family protein [Ilumatobacter sp.]|nr:fumarylacetoacetate hydrolase family protein [Ilumatobacter sp.]